MITLLYETCSCLREFGGDILKENPYKVIDELVKKEILSFFESIISEVEVPINLTDTSDHISLMKDILSRIDLSQNDLSLKLFNHKDYCKKHDIKEKDFMKLYLRLSPFYKEAVDFDDMAFTRMIFYERSKFKITTRDILTTHLNNYHSLKSMKDSFSKKQRSQINLNNYFFMVESIYSSYLDLILHILIFGGYKYSDKRKKNIIQNISDIKKSFLANKLEFLNEVGLKVISNGCNRNLRNAIAHCDYFIDDDGDIFIEKEDNKIDIVNEINILKTTIQAIEGSIQKCSADRYVDIIKKGKDLLNKMDEIDDKINKTTEN